ncbi:hypothetical protein LU276_03915 [Moraxella haemolytica]|uniref:primase-helicase zinc-binding domain-containing protein n=1 Tax=Moraxella haemolytica TaxID=2904119 RepID=UPI002543DC58|nr:primase-helicase zinc-binding domain-containing protein [Moraxella sp. ZY171148]WII95969.1 hypothetical protein LU276_03915 [Moraxella sp. ZY171148]
MTLLSLLGTHHTFQTFDDNADRKDKALARQLHGTLDEHAHALHALNAQGAGVYVTVNATDGKGRTKANITAVRALFVDFDTPDDSRPARLLGLPVPPSVIVESSAGKHHAYWVVDGIGLDEFSEYQKRLIAYFTQAGDTPDKAVHDLPRVMRLDSFIHTKVKDGVASDAFVSRVVHEGDKVDLFEILAWLDVKAGELPLAPAKSAAPIRQTAQTDTASQFVRQQARGAWQFVLGRLGYHIKGGGHEPCPHCGGKDRFRFDDNSTMQGDGGWICSQGGKGNTGGDGLSFLIDHVGMSASDAVRAVAGVLNLDLPKEEVVLGDVSSFINQVTNTQNKTAPMAVGAEEFVHDDDFVLPAHHSTKEVPEQLLSFPVPILNEVRAWIDGHSRQPQAQISIQATLALASVLCGRIYQSTEANTSSLYLMVLGETGIGKNYAKTGIQAFLTQSNLVNLLSGGGNTSSGAVYSALHESPCHIQIMDEIGKQLQTARKQQNGQMAESFTTLVEAYSATTSLMMPKNYSNMGRRKSDQVSKAKQMVHCPAITLLGLATPAQMYDNLSTVDVEDGFLNRLICVEASLPVGEKVRRKAAPLPAHLIDWAVAIRTPKGASRTDLTGLDTAYNVAPTPKMVQIDDEALDLFDDTADLLTDQETAGEFVLPDMTRRWVENAMRAATLLAVCQDSNDPIITANLASWALSYVLYYGQDFMDSVSRRVADSDHHRLRQAIYDMIVRSGKNGMTERDLAKNSRLYAASMPHQREQATTALLNEEQIVAVKINTISGRGRKRLCFILPKYYDENTMELA